MAVGVPFQRQFPPLCIQETGRRGTGDDGTNRGDGNTRLPRGLRESVHAIAGDRAQDFVVVAAGDEGLDADHLSRQQRARR